MCIYRFACTAGRASFIINCSTAQTESININVESFGSLQTSLVLKPDHLARLGVRSFKQIIPLKGNRAFGQSSPITHAHSFTLLLEMKTVFQTGILTYAFSILWKTVVYPHPVAFVRT